MKRLLLLTIGTILFSFNSNSQPTLTIANSNTGLPCHYIQVEVSASGFPDTVGALNLYISTNGNVIQYISKLNGKINPLINQTYYNLIGISWTNTNPFNINGVLFTMILHYDGNGCEMDWREDTSEVVSIHFVELFPNYVNGNITEGSHTFNTWYVDASKPAGGDGLSWESAFNSIQTAANIPPKAGEKVLIKPGTYSEKVTIKSDAGYSVKPTTGVILSDTNKITFPNGANLLCVQLATYPDQYYAYVYRSWSSNNGYYKVIEVNDAQNYIRVEGAAFIPETGVANNRGKVMAAVGRPVIYKKDPAASESQRVIVNAPNSSTFDAFYVGKPSGDGQTTADSANWNIIEGIDITNSSTGSLKGLHIKCSAYNVYAKGKIYNTMGTGGIGINLAGISSRQAKYNIIQNNEIYNTPYQGILLGHTTTGASTNYSNFNQVVDNNFYLSGTSALARFDNAVKVQTLNKSNVIEGNNFHDINIYTAGNGAVLVSTKADSTLIYNNIFRNIGKAAGNSGTTACIMMDSTIYKLNAFNNIIYNDDIVTNDVYAFRIYGRRHVASKVCYNTIYKIDNAFYLQDNTANGANIDFSIQDNIVSPTVTYFNNVGTSGRFNVTYNLFRLTPGAPYASGTGNIVGNPQFIEPDGSNMYGLILLPSSPAMNTGTPVANITRDYLGEQRNATTPTMGAFENTMSCTWTGATSTNWHTGTNWKLNMVPQNYMNAIILNVTNDPVVSFSNAVCKSLKLNTGASIRVVSPYVITVNN
jgi:hypothetical protein